MGAHARLSPSSADRWMRCFGSVEAERAEPNEENEWSAEGTVAHWVLEQCLRYGFEALDFLGKVKRVGQEKQFRVVIDEEMCQFLQPIIDEIVDYGYEQYYELRLDLSAWLPEQFGTLDVGIVVQPLGLVVIRDLKFGKGLPVQPEHNAQLMIYAAGFWDQIASKVWKRKDKPKFRIIIDQPRNDGGGGEWEVSYEDLMLFMVDVKRAGVRTYDADAKRTPGEKQCTYCRAAMNGHCRAYDEYQFAKLPFVNEDLELQDMGRKREPKLELPEPETLDPLIRARILDQAPSFRQWLNRLHAAAIDAGLKGEPNGGKKVVLGRQGHRKWVDPKTAKRWLERNMPDDVEIYAPASLISPAVAEKALAIPKKKAAQLLSDSGQIMQDDGKPVLVSELDPRPAVEPYSAKFQVFTDDDE